VQVAVGFNSNQLHVKVSILILFLVQDVIAKLRFRFEVVIFLYLMPEEIAAQNCHTSMAATMQF